MLEQLVVYFGFIIVLLSILYFLHISEHAFVVKSVTVYVSHHSMYFVITWVGGSKRQQGILDTAAI